MVNGIINPQVHQLQGQIKQVNQQTRNANNQANALYNRGKGDLGYVHGETADYLNGLGAKNDSNYASAQSQQQAAAQALQAQLANTYSGAQDAGQQELNRLGISQMGNFGGLSQDYANNSALAGQASQNVGSSMAMSNQNAASMLAGIGAMNQGSYTSGIGQNLNARNDALALNRQNRIDQVNKVQDAIRTAQGTRKDVFMQLLQQLQQSGFSQYVTAKQNHMLGGHHHKK